MSRGGWYSDDEGSIPQRMWQYNLESSLYSPKGQQMLCRLRDALLALPKKALIAGDMAGDGLVCALGALEAQRLAELNGDPLEKVIEWMQDAYDGTSNGLTVLIGRDLGFSMTAATSIASANDEEWMELSPEGRYDYMLEWVQSYILPIPASEIQQRYPYILAFFRILRAYNPLLSVHIESALQDDPPATAVYRKGTGVWMLIEEFMVDGSQYDRPFRERVKEFGDQLHMKGQHLASASA